MVSKSFAVLLLLSFVSFSSAAEADSRNLQIDLGCAIDELPIFDEDCLADAEEARDDAFDAAEDLFEEQIEDAQKDARDAIEKADNKLRRKVTARKLQRKCADEANFNSCAVAFIERQRSKFNDAQEAALEELEQAEEDAADDRKAARKAARRVFNDAQEDCGECVQFSFRF